MISENIFTNRNAVWMSEKPACSYYNLKIVKKGQR